MSTPAFTLFDTPLGRCAISWNDAGVCGLQLPERNDRTTVARVHQRTPGIAEAPPPTAALAAINGIGDLLHGRVSDLSRVPLDLAGVPPFHRRVYQAARAIPPGHTVTYGALATALGEPGAARAVGQALGRNPFAIIVPCHRVLAAGHRVGGFSAAGGITTKLKLLGLERVHGPAAADLLTGLDGGADGAPDFDRDTAVAHLRNVDPALRALIDRVGPLRLQLDRTSSLFVALAEAIVYQQLTAKAAATIFARVRALYPRPHEAPTPEQILRTPAAKLRAAGLSQNKLLALRDLAQKARGGDIPGDAEVRGLTDAELVERLTRVRGIGRWTVEMLLIFQLGRPDVLPLGDLGIRKGFAAVHGLAELPTEKALAQAGAAWAPFRSAASWYLWRAADSPEP